jgi:hypothetical protein
MKLVSLNTGLPREVVWRGINVTTGIFKQPVEGRVALRELNLDGDRQADLTVHGGEFKAVYCCSVTCPVNVVSRGHGSQLVSEFFGCGRQAVDAALAITVFECGGTFVHVRLAPSQEPVNKSS